jgi:monothiol glutaredoxin
MPGGCSEKERELDINVSSGIKEYSDWPTIPQLYIDKEFVGGCDILLSMHESGELTKMLEEKKVLSVEDREPKSES